MISFNAGAWRFNYRVGGVIVRDGHVLLMRIGSGKFWFVPRGRIEAAEPAKAALERQVAEELGVAGQIGRMLWAVALAPRLRERPGVRVWQVTSGGGRPPRRRPPQHANVAYAPDYDGDGRAELAVWRARTGEWLILGSCDGSLVHRTWGPGDTVTVRDYDGDGRADIAVFGP